ncbi:Na+/melibiose symporter [Paramaledivibacter caminithermalis DSM 15212]|uniref:Na+/melibiose symporter n=2 Tax=Paramaledivibacter TaxID=1884934 RepID=A0A1M6QAC6_PARC5|nr:Na+/melibiose symporter [Paramaledivibacter caminithermalis DSM 15212]
MSLLYFSGVLGQSISGYICDLKSTIKKVHFFWMLFLATSIFFFFKANHTIHRGILILIIGFFQSSVMVLLDSWTLESNNTLKKNFGPIRAFGSVGWGISTLIIGKIIDSFGWSIVGILYIFFTSLFLVITYNTKDAKHENHKKDGPSITVSNLKLLMRNKKYIHLLIIFFILYMSFHVIGMFSVILIEDFGGTKAHIGVFLLVAALSEVPILLSANKLMYKFKPSQLLIVSSAFFLIRTLLTAFSNSVVFIILLSILQMLSFSILIFISKYLIDEVSPDNLKTSSQSIAMAISGGLSALVSLNLSGYLADSIGIRNLLFLLTILCAAALILSIRYHLSYSLYILKKRL